MIENLRNDHLEGKYDFPKILVSAYNILSNWKNNPNNVIRIIISVNYGVAFFQHRREIKRQQGEGTGKYWTKGIKSHHLFLLQ